MSAPAVKPENTTADDEKSSGTSNAGRKKSSVVGCFVQLLTFAMVTCAIGALGYFFYHESPAEDENDVLDNSMVIVESAAGDPERSVDADDPALAPPCSITSTISQEAIEAAEHPLDPLMEMAHFAVKVVEENVQDYTATIIKRVRSGGKLHGEQHMFCKIRHESGNSEEKTPFSVYTRFKKPKSLKGQEAIWVEGENDDKLIAHTTGILNVISFHLDPEGPVAMRGNRYSIRNIGMLNLIKKMIRKGEEERKYGECQVLVHRDVKVGNANCTRIEIIHPEPRDYFDFYMAKIYFDDELDIPIAYESYLWPSVKGGKPPLIERYYYSDVKLNVGLTDEDFDPANKSYSYPDKS